MTTKNEILAEVLTQSFELNRYMKFIREFFNSLEMTKHVTEKTKIPTQFIYTIESYHHLAFYTDNQSNRIAILTVKLKSGRSVERSRSVQRNFVSKIISDAGCDAAIVAFYTDNDPKWRLSFVRLDQTWDAGKFKTTITPAKRYSYLVGEQEPCHTAKERLFPIFESEDFNPTLNKIEEAFSVEAVTDEFFKEYKELFLQLSDYLDGDTKIKAILKATGTDIPRFTKKLLGQIVFLYFLQKKGWLGVPKNDVWGQGQKNFLQLLYEKAIAEGKNFYKEYLQYLFYEALARQHGDNNYYKRFDCRIPFLNGGLFEANYDWENTPVQIPNTLFRNKEKVKKTGNIGTGILDVFDRYNFTIREDEPLEKEVAIDPEMLGKVFENMLEITERKSKGAFYTPREIVHYMCQESLIHYLDNAINNNDTITIPKEDIETFVHNGILTVDNDIGVADIGKETDTYNNNLSESIYIHADTIDKLLTNIKICDPAIGSGAFPVELLNELVYLQLALCNHLSGSYLAQKLNIIGLKPEEYDRHPDKYAYRVKHHSIQESIYGVDIDASAIDIARLRLWLSLVVDEEDFDNIEALPNLDYKIVCGSSLIGIPETVLRDLNLAKELEKLKETFFAENNEIHKKELRIKINNKIRELLDSIESLAGYKIDFDYKLFFSEVWRKKGGFDIVIGNPPWLALIGKQLQKYKKIDESKNLKIYQEQYIFNSYMPNLYELFLQRSFNITHKEGGFLSFIIPDRFGYNETNKELRDFFIINSRIVEIVYRWNFPNIVADTMTFMCMNQKTNSNYEFHIKHDSNSPFLTFFLSEIKNDKEFMFRSFDSYKTKELIFDIKNKSENLVKYAKSTSGFGAIAGTITKNKENERQRPVLKGSSIAPYILRDYYYFDFRPENLGGRTRDVDKLSIKNKVLLRKTGYPLICSFDNQGFYPEQSLYFFYDLSDKISNEYLLSLFNSSIYNWFYKNYLVTNIDSTPQLKNKDLDNFPIILLNNNASINIITLYILFLARKQNQTSVVFNFFTELSDSFIFEIFFPEEVHAANKGIIKYLHDLKPIDESMTDNQKLAIINNEFERLYDPYHPVRNNVETLDNVEVVRIIKESLRK
jgi:hypothetical protein